MLSLYIKGKEAALPEDIELVLKRRNEMIDDRKEDATYPFKLSLRANRHIFGPVDRIVNNKFDLEFPAVVRFGIYNILDGFVVVTDISEDEIEIYIATQKKSFWSEANTCTVKESVRDYENFINEAGATKAMEDSISGLKNYVCCPLLDQTYTETSLIPPAEQMFQKEINPYDINTRTFSFVKDGKVCVFMFFMRLKYVINYLLDYFGYSISENYLDSLEGFDDVLVINRSGAVVRPLNINYAWCLPDIKVKKFIEEIETKFNVIFVPDARYKTVRIISFNSFIGRDNLLVEIQDGVTKNVLERDDIPTGYHFKDNDVDDSSLDSIKNLLEKEVGTGELKQVECISTTLATIHDGINYGAAQNNIATINFSNVNGDYLLDKTIPEELRFAVYRGFYKKDSVPVPSTEPYMSAESEWAGSNPFNLTWLRGLYSLHSAKVDFMLARKMTHEVTLWKPLSYLGRISDFFEYPVLIRGQKYVTMEIEIKLGRDRIVEFIFRGYPL